MFELRISYRDNAHCPIRSRKREKEVLSQSVKITSEPVKGHHQLWDHWGNYFRRKPITSRIHTIPRIPRMCIHTGHPRYPKLKGHSHIPGFLNHYRHPTKVFTYATSKWFCQSVIWMMYWLHHFKKVEKDMKNDQREKRL